METKNGKNRVDAVLPADASTAEIEADSEKKQGISLLARIALAVVVIVSLIISVVSIMRYNELETRRDELQRDIERYDQENDELEQLIKAPVDKDYIARMARERLGLHYPDEDVYYSRYNNSGN